MARISVLVADDQRLFAEAVGLALARFPDLVVVGVHVANGPEAVHEAIRVRSDAVLYDFWMRGTRGPAAARYLAAWSPATRVVLLSWLHGPFQVSEAVKAGAAGLVPKTVTLTQLADSVRAAHLGEPLVHAEAPRTAPVVGSAFETWEALRTLTPRELSVLHLLCEGYSSQEVAARLGIAPGTARNHVNHILRKTNTRSRQEAIALARRVGLLREVTPPSP